MTTDVRTQLVEALSKAGKILAGYPYERLQNLSGLCDMWRHVLQAAPQPICITAARQVALYFHDKAETGVGYEFQRQVEELAIQICQWRRRGLPGESYQYPPPENIDTLETHEQLSETLRIVEELHAGEKESWDSYLIPCRELCSMWRYVMHTAPLPCRAAAARQVMYFRLRLQKGIDPDLQLRVDTLAREIAALYPVPIPQP